MSKIALFLVLNTSLLYSAISPLLSPAVRLLISTKADLHKLVAAQDFESVKRAIRTGADLNASGGTCAKRILEEIAQFPFDVAKTLLEHGADISYVDKPSYTLLNTFASDLRWRDEVYPPIGTESKLCRFNAGEQTDILKKVMLLVFNGACTEMSRDYRSRPPWDTAHPFMHRAVLPDVVAFLTAWKIYISDDMPDTTKDRSLEDIYRIMNGTGIRVEDLFVMPTIAMMPACVQE